MNKTTLYKLNTNGKPIQWSITVNRIYSDGLAAWTVSPEEIIHSDNIEIGRIIIETGQVDGKKVTQTIDITEGKNIGKANETTPYTQAVSEAKAKLELQLRSGYVYNLEDVKESGTLGSGIKQPLLAQKHDPTGKQKGSKTLEKMKIKGKKIHVQPKLDGNRCLIKVTPNTEETIVREGLMDFQTGNIVMYTRKGDVMPVQLQHIIDRVREEFDVIQDIILDGELFSDELSFNELNGHLKRKDSQDPEQLAKIKYHLYDVMVDKPYSERYEMLKRFHGRGIEVIPSFEVVATDEIIKEKLEEFLAEGHEGLMIRTLDTGYENKRSWQLCKVKLFEDFETEIVDLEEDTMGRLGFFIMKMPTPVLDRDGKLVDTFKAGLSGIDHEEGRKMLANKDKYIGKQATIEHFGWDIRPRFPKFKGVREDI